MSGGPLEPTCATEVAALLARAKADGRKIAPRGSGTKSCWINAEPVDSWLSTRGLAEPVEHYAGDLVATIPAGATLTDANGVLGRSGQWLPIDPTHAERATIGGIVATNDSGPRRHQHGSPRDLIIGVEVALADGRVVKAGGRVVKNVAGYDLSRLLCGSHGSLGVITSATFKLAPVAPASRTVVAQFADVAGALAHAQSLSAAPITASAIEIEAPTARLLVRFETTERAAEHMAAHTRTLLSRGGATTSLMMGAEEEDLWVEHARLVWARTGCVVKISVVPTELPSVFDLLSRAGRHARPGVGGDWTAVGRATLGVLLVRLGGNAEQQVEVIDMLRSTLGGRSGHVTVLAGLDGSRTRTPEAPTDRGGLGALMRAVKHRFDPTGVLPRAPGM
jgi:glycolate oxidase FAD binding subunit